jgi:hypothetical protein
MPALQAIEDVAAPLLGEYAFIAGGGVAAAEYSEGVIDKRNILNVPNLEFAYDDIDVFVPTREQLVVVVQKYLDHGYVLVGDFATTWRRWRLFGTGHWHTNSIKLESLKGVEVNVIFKSHGGHPVRTHGQVSESFDFGHVCVVFSTYAGTWKDNRRAQVDTYRPGNRTEFNLLDDKVEDWEAGLFSEHIGLRECGRYGRYVDRGYEYLTQAAVSLAKGYEMAALHYRDKDDPNKRWLGEEFYPMVAEAIRLDDIPQLVELDKLITPRTAIDMLREALI